MASITTLLATDSLSSSRIVLNDNFTAINDEVNIIAGLLDTSAQTLTLTGSVNGGSLSLATGGFNLFVVNSTDIIASLPVTIEKDLILGEGMQHSVSTNVAILPSIGGYNRTTYAVTGFTGPQTLADGLEGQEVTFINEHGNDFEINPADLAGVTTSCKVHTNGTITLRYVGTSWYIISSFNATIVV